jgi:hypothetical protein
LLYLCWLPLQESYIQLLSVGAERIFGLVDSPPLITALQAQGNRIAYFSFITGGEQPLGIWNGANLHFYLVTALALVLSVPLSGRGQRIRLVTLTGILFVAMSLAICAVNIKTNADRSATQLYGIVLYGGTERVVLDWANRTLLMVGMLAFPAYLFFVSYLSRWVEPAATRVRFTRKRLVSMLVLGLSILIVGTGLFVWTAPTDDLDTDHEGWAKIMTLNPDFAPAKVNVALWHQQQGRLDEAIVLYREALALDRTQVQTHFNLGNALRSQVHREEAIAQYEQALQLDPGHAATHWNLGLTWFELQQYCRALRHYETSAQLVPAYLNQAAFREDLTALRVSCPGGSNNGLVRSP